MGEVNGWGIVGDRAVVRFEAWMVGDGPGSGSVRVIQATTSGVELFQSAFNGLRAHSAPQVKRLWEALSKINGVRLYGPPPDVDRTPTVSFVVKDVTSTDVARRLAESGLFASHGDFYAQTTVARLGTTLLVL